MTEPPRPDGRFRQPDTEFGWVLRPGFEGWTADEARVWVRINRDGLRDREHSLEKPAGSLRVALLGDSYLEALNVPFEKTFAALLESQLQGCAQPHGQVAEVINFGVAGYSTAQELLTYRARARKYHPDIVVLAVYTGNDIHGNHAALNPASDRKVSPYFVFQGDTLKLVPPSPELIATTAHQPQDEVEPIPPGAPWYQRIRLSLTNRSKAATLLYQSWATWRNRSRPVPPEADRYDDSLENAIYQPPARPEFHEAWRVTEALLQTVARDVEADGAEFWLVTLGTAAQMDPDLGARQKLAARLGVPTLDYADDRIRNWADAHGIRHVMLTEPLAAFTASSRQYVHGGYLGTDSLGLGHWNETGNGRAAEIVGRQLCVDSRVIAGSQ